MIKPKIKYFVVFILSFLFLSIPPVFALEVHLIYDENGNLITGDGKYREYDEFNRLVRVRAGFNNVSRILEEYVYHPTEDRILAKKVYDFNQNLIETIVYVNDNLVRKINSTGTFDTVYVKDQQGIVAELQPNGKKIYYHNDHLGSTTLITNQSGSVVENTSYAPFGEILSGGNVSRFDYEGKEFSSGTGYGEGTQDYDFHFRKFDPGLKIFTKPESLFPNLYDPQQLNRYAFERNNPYKYVDKNGRGPEVVVGAILIVGLAVGLIYADYYAYQELSNSRKPDLGVYFHNLGAGFTAGTIGAGTAIIAGATSTLGIVGLAGSLAIGYAGAYVSGANSQLYLDATENTISFQKANQEGIIGIGIYGAFKFSPKVKIGTFGYCLSEIVQQITSSYASNQINLAQQVSGCNPSKQNCSPPQTSSGGTGGGAGSFGNDPGATLYESIFGGSADVVFGPGSEIFKKPCSFPRDCKS